MKSLTLAASAAVIATVCAGAAHAESWHTFSRSGASAFMADVDSISVLGDDTTIVFSRIPLRSETANDYSHGVETVVFRCAANEVRTISSVDYGPDGAEVDRYDDAEAAFEKVDDGSLLSYLKPLACDGERANPPIWTSMKAFVDGGRRLPR